MIVIIQGSGDNRGVWTVACHCPGLAYTPLRDCKSLEEAMSWMSYLNGGAHPSEKR